MERSVIRGLAPRRDLPRIALRSIRATRSELEHDETGLSSEFAARPIQPDFIPLWSGRGEHTISEYWKNIPELPDVSSRLVERRQPPATLHGVVFDILAARLRRRVPPPSP